jgi:hypothetical protein
MELERKKNVREKKNKDKFDAREEVNMASNGIN